MYVLARDVFNNGRTIPKGTRLSDVYEIHDRSVVAIAHFLGLRIRLNIIKADLVFGSDSAAPPVPGDNS